MSFDNFIDWSYFGSFTGVMPIVCLIVQFSKEYVDKLPFKIPTQIYSYLVAVVVIFLVEIFEVGGDGLHLSEAVLGLFNGLIVSVASNGSYEVINKLLKQESS